MYVHSTFTSSSILMIFFSLTSGNSGVRQWSWKMRNQQELYMTNPWFKSSLHVVITCTVTFTTSVTFLISIIWVSQSDVSFLIASEAMFSCSSAPLCGDANELHTTDRKVAAIKRAPQPKNLGVSSLLCKVLIQPCYLATPPQWPASSRQPLGVDTSALKPLNQPRACLPQLLSPQIMTQPGFWS